MLIVNPELKVPLREIQFSYVRSSGPGGQAVNKVNSKAVLRWNPGYNASLPRPVVERFLARFAHKLTGEGDLVLSSDEHRDRLQDDFAELAQLYIERGDELQALWHSGPNTVIHGDPHLGNLFDDHGRTGFLDWGIVNVSSPMRDASYFLTMAMGIDDRRVEPTEQFDIVLLQPVGATIAAPGRAAVTVLDDDASSSAQLSVSDTRVVEGGRRAIVQLSLEYAPAPPFRSGTPAEASPAVLAEAKERLSGSRRVREEMFARWREERGSALPTSIRA